MSGEINPVLADAIMSADLNRLRMTLLKICRQSEAMQDLLIPELVVTVSDDSGRDTSESDDQEESASEEDDSESDDIPAASREIAPNKRARPRFAKCIQCEEEFDVNHNSKGSCIWHDGELVEDSEEDFWPDHDERVHGPIDTEENMKDYPERFIWSCCEEPGTAEGCRVGRHREEERFMERPRI